MTTRRWKFLAETEDSHGYLVASGEMVSDPGSAIDWLGTDHDAAEEASRRAVLFETNNNACIERIVYESQGKVTPHCNKTQTEGLF